jgi:hypothetical protein
MLNGFALISLISFLVCLILGIFVYFKNVRYVINNKLGKIFVLICFSLAFFWALIEFGYRFAPNYEVAYLWLKANVFWYIVLSLLLHFTLVYTKNNKLLKKKITYLFIYSPAILFIILDIYTPHLFTTPIKAQWGWFFGIPLNPILYGISTTWAVFIIIFCLYIFIEYLSTVKTQIKKRKIKLTIIGISIPISVGFNTEWLLPLMNIRVPELAVPTLTLGLIIIWYAKWIYSPTLKGYSQTKIEVDNLLNKFSYRNSQY